MSIGFDESDDYYTISDAAALTLPDGDWCVGIWIKVDDNAGTAFQYLISNGNYSANNTIQLFLAEASEANNPDEWVWDLRDGDGTHNGANPAATAVGADGKWRLLVLQRNTSENRVELWYCECWAMATLEHTDADTDFGSVNGGDWNIGRRAEGDPDRYYGSVAAEFFKGNWCLNSAEITALGTGLRPQDLGHVPDVYLEMFSADATLVDAFGANNATQSSAPTSETHPPMRSPRAVAFNDAPSLY